MRIQDMLAEYGLEIDDVRWYLSMQLARRFLEYRTRLDELARLVWSGQLEAELYRMEDRLINDLQQKLDGGIADEHSIRTVLREMVMEKRSRRPR